MTETRPPSESTETFVIEYRLTEADVRDYANSGKFRACRQLVRNQGWGLVPLVAVGLVLVGLCYRSHGARSVGLMLAVTLIVLGALGWLRRARLCRRECRLARDAGVPLEIRLSVSRAGIVKDDSGDGADPGRTFGWPDVVEIGRLDHLTVIRLRTAGGVLLIPDRAFPDNQARGRIMAEVAAWREAAAPARSR